MDLATKLSILADAAKYDASCASSGTTKRDSRAGGIGSTTGTGICHSYTPDGRCVSLLKILLTNFCIYDCLYCINRSRAACSARDSRAEEVVQLTLDFYRRNYIEGLFLSSGHHSESPTTRWSKWCASRGRCGWIISSMATFISKRSQKPSPELIAEAGRWADRISINVELPTAADLEIWPRRKIWRASKSR